MWEGEERKEEGNEERGREKDKKREAGAVSLKGRVGSNGEKK